jgi:hypothetical protein
MTEETFEQMLRTYLRRKPFLPFVVELESGEQILIAEPTLAFDGGEAGYLSPSYELKEFACEQVRDIRPVTLGTAS